MTLKQLIQDAVRLACPQRAGQAAECMRFQHGLNYADSMKLVQKCCPDVTDVEDKWEELLGEADRGERYDRQPSIAIRKP